MQTTQTRLTIYRKDKQPINDTEVAKISSDLDMLSFQIQSANVTDSCDFCYSIDDAQFFTVTQTAIEINLSDYIKGSTFNSVKEKLSVVLKKLRDKLESAYGYQVRLL